MSARATAEITQELADREAIRDCLYRYCRGSDRLDPELIASTLWPEATADYGSFKCGSAQEIVETVVSALKQMEQAKHQIGNCLIEIDGNFASVEAYSLGFKRASKPDGTRYERVTSSRYVDRMERRNNEWRVLKRLVLTDWAQEFPANDIGNGARKPKDRSYEFLSF